MPPRSGATTLQITLRTLTPGGGTGPGGAYQYGPAPVAAADTEGLITIDRTPAGGFNATAAATADLTLYQSNDGGGSWMTLASAHIVGGQIVNDDPKVAPGTIHTYSEIRVQYYPGTNRQVRAEVAVQGAAVAISGTLATQ